MAVLVEMPKANENMTEGTVGRWLVPEGSRVEVETALVEIITDKAVFELPSPAAGVLLKKVADERSVVPVGYVIAIIGEEGESAPDVEERNRKILAEHAAAMMSLKAEDGEGKVEARATAAPAAARPMVRATPAARRLARELGIDLLEVSKTVGSDRPVNEADVRAFLELSGRAGSDR